MISTPLKKNPRQKPVQRRKFLCYTAVGVSTLAMPALGKSSTGDLQRQLNQLIQKQRKEGRISHHERTAWSVYDFQNKTKLVSINEDHSMQAASMIKVFVALAYFYLNKQNPRKYPYNSSHRHLMERMLVKSDNSATNMIMRLCKGPINVQRLCQKATHNRFKQLHIVEYIPNGGRTYRNKASAHDYSRYLYDLWYNKFPHSAEIKRIMSIKNHDRITATIMPPRTRVFDKTGSTGMLCGDMGIVYLGDSKKTYTFIGIIERSQKTKNYARWIRRRSNSMREASQLTYKFMHKHYNLLKSIE